MFLGSFHSPVFNCFNVCFQRCRCGGVLFDWLFQYNLIKCLEMCFSASRTSSLGPYPYHITTYIIPYGVLTQGIMQLTMCSCCTVYHSLSVSLRLHHRFVAVGFCGGRDSCNPWGEFSVVCTRVSESLRKSMETPSGMLSSSSVTVCHWAMSTLYNPDVRRSRLLYRWLSTSSETSYTISAYWGCYMNT